MSHNCNITIDNSQNPDPLVLTELRDFKDTSNTPDGKFENVNPSNATIAPGLIVPANESLSFDLKRDLLLTSGATMNWTTGNATDKTEANVKMTFRNSVSGNVVTLDIEHCEGSPKGLLTYGVSYFSAAEGDSLLARDYINKTGSGKSPVTATFSIVYNKYVSTPPSTPSLEGITNVVMLMLENRGFDHLLGDLYSTNPANVFPPNSPIPPSDPSVQHPINFDGLFNNPTISNPPPKDGTTDNNPNTSNQPPKDPLPVYMTPVTELFDPETNLSVPSVDPGEQWADTNEQLFNSTDVPSNNAIPKMKGFISNYEKQKGSTPDEIMQYYTPTVLPVLNSLAKNYGVSDAWFCSVPSQTSPNRAFSLTGTSEGYVDNYTIPGIPKIPLIHNVFFKSNTLFNVLNNCGKKDAWRIYYQDEILGRSFTESLFEELEPFKGTDNIQSFEKFLEDIDNGTLPPFSYVEPTWLTNSTLGYTANDYHPPYNLCAGEQNLALVYNALTKYKDWDSTLFIVTFDEHGGTFDHVPPPHSITPPDDLTDWSGFDFSRLGLRVPTLLISPRIKNETVFRSPNETPFDHTSFISTILGWQGIDVSGGVMGARAAKAPDFSGVLANTAVNKDTLQLSPTSCSTSNIDPELNDLQKYLLPILAKNLTGDDINSESTLSTLKELKAMKTNKEVCDYVAKTRG